MTGRLPYPLVHLELHTDDFEGARTFYDGLCGWRQEQVDVPAGSYLALEFSEGVGGGIVECPIQRPMWLPYFEVPRIECATDQAQLGGAAVLLEPREGPSGWRSVVRTTAGGELAFWQRKR